MNMKSIRIVLASPSDLTEERTLITNIVNNTDKRFKRQGVTLDLRRWEDTVPGANPIGGQGIIDNDLGIEEADIFICLYWKKVGTVIEGLNETGTEHELNAAIESFRVRGKPDIKFLLKKVEMADKDEDYKKIEKIEKIAQKIQPLALYKEFSSVDELKGIMDEILLAEFFNKTTAKSVSYEERKYVEASSESQFLDALIPNQRVILHNKFYDILSSTSKSPYVQLEEVFDGQEIIIRDVTNLTLLGDQTKIITVPRYATVLTFRNCESITLSNLTIGHTPHKGECIGAVLKFEECNNIILNNLELFGCGTYGIELTNTSNVTMNGCHIYECTSGAIRLFSSDLEIKNTTISDCTNLIGCLINLEASYMNMVNVFICNNETTESIFALKSSNIYGEAISLSNNKYASLGWETDKLKLSNNIILNTYPAEVYSKKKISYTEFKKIKDFISEKSQIENTSFEDGIFSILFCAPDLETINKYELYFANNSDIEMACG